MVTVLERKTTINQTHTHNYRPKNAHEVTCSRIHRTCEHCEESYTNLCLADTHTHTHTRVHIWIFQMYTNDTGRPVLC